MSSQSVANYYGTSLPQQQSVEPEEKFGQVPVFMDGQLQIVDTEKADQFPPPEPSFKNLFVFMLYATISIGPKSDVNTKYPCSNNHACATFSAHEPL